MIDIHTHILPNTDDGAENMEIALSCLSKIQEVGVTDVFLTPHYIPGEYDNTGEIIDRKCTELRKTAKENDINVNLHCGVEFYLTGTGQKETDFSGFRLGNSDYVLVETAMHGFPVNLFEILYIMVKKGYKPILAHPERYMDIMKDSTIAEDLIYRNVYLQANAGSFIGDYGKIVSRTAWEMLQKGFYHFIASDHHCNTNHYSLQVISNLFAEDYPEYPLDMLINENPARIIRNEKIEYFNPPILMNKENGNSKGFFQKILQFFDNE